MTREEAILNLKVLKEDYWDDDGYGNETKQYDDTMLALDMAIKALEQEPKTESCEDCISRQAVLDTLYNFSVEHGNDYERVRKHINELPSVAIPSAEPKTGHWIKENPPMVERYPFCSECGFVNPFENALNYCPNCGAKMD